MQVSAFKQIQLFKLQCNPILKTDPPPTLKEKRLQVNSAKGTVLRVWDVLVSNWLLT